MKAKLKSVSKVCGFYYDWYFCKDCPIGNKNCCDILRLHGEVESNCEYFHGLDLTNKYLICTHGYTSIDFIKDLK